MKHLFLTLSLSLATILAPGADLPEIRLWPETMPDPNVPADPPERTERGQDGLTRRFNVSIPRLFVHEPAPGTPRTGASVLVVPGGGFGKLADEHEGSDACAWLAKQGLVAFQLAYRTPTTKHPDPAAGPVQDVQRTVSEIRRRAGELRIDPAKIGVLGFSAGGQVTLIAATNDRRYADPGPAPTHQIGRAHV